MYVKYNGDNPRIKKQIYKVIDDVNDTYTIQSYNGNYNEVYVVLKKDCSIYVQRPLQCPYCGGRTFNFDHEHTRFSSPDIHHYIKVKTKNGIEIKKINDIPKCYTYVCATCGFILNFRFKMPFISHDCMHHLYNHNEGTLSQKDDNIEDEMWSKDLNFTCDEIKKPDFYK